MCLCVHKCGLHVHARISHRVSAPPPATAETPDSFKGAKRTSSPRSSRSGPGTASGPGKSGVKAALCPQSPDGAQGSGCHIPRGSLRSGSNRCDGGRVPPLPCAPLALHCPHVHPPGSPGPAQPARPSLPRPRPSPGAALGSPRSPPAGGPRALGAAATRVNKQLSLEKTQQTR